MVDDAMYPDTAHLALGAIGENRCVLHRDVTLIIGAVRNPATQRFGRKPALIHCDVKRMFVVISVPADFSQVRDKGLMVPQSRGHKMISNPSHAISIPAC